MRSSFIVTLIFPFVSFPFLSAVVKITYFAESPYSDRVGDIVTLKKGHPCGSKDWEILRVGADFRLKCMGCGHQIMVPRKMVEKNTRNLKKQTCENDYI